MQTPINIREQFNQLPDNWIILLEPFTYSFNNIQDKIVLDSRKHNIYPKPDNIFRAFNELLIDDIKVVILGQDCYHQPDQATGRAFGIAHNHPIPPSLRNISKELYNDTNIILDDFTLEKWSKNGVLLLNCALTVLQSSPGSHRSIWKDFTDNVIKEISSNTDNIVFLLWGKYAQSKKHLISQDKNHLVLCSNHPSPLSANRGGWFGNSHFSKTNNFLLSNNKEQISW